MYKSKTKYDDEKNGIKKLCNVQIYKNYLYSLGLLDTKCPGDTNSALRRRDKESRSCCRYHSTEKSLSWSSPLSEVSRSLLSRKHIGGKDGVNVSGDNDGE